MLSRRSAFALPLSVIFSSSQAGKIGDSGKSKNLPSLEATNEQREDFVAALSSRSISGRLKTDRFVEPIFYMLSPFTWRESEESKTGFSPVTVPKGFVSDLASIPRIFYSFYRPDGEYAQAAVIHDYLYWSQSRPRGEADLIFKSAMNDLKISVTDVEILYQSVSLFGRGAWKENAKLKLLGEKRILKKFPEENMPAVRWIDWKKDFNVFE